MSCPPTRRTRDNTFEQTLLGDEANFPLTGKGTVHFFSSGKAGLLGHGPSPIECGGGHGGKRPAETTVAPCALPAAHFLDPVSRHSWRSFVDIHSLMPHFLLKKKKKKKHILYLQADFSRFRHMTVFSERL